MNKQKQNQKLRRFGYRVFLYVILISFIMTFNLFFGIFVWNEFDKSPNFAMGFVSLLMIILIIYNWIMDKKTLLQEVHNSKP